MLGHGDPDAVPHAAGRASPSAPRRRALVALARRPYTAGVVDQAEVMQGLDRLSDQMHDLDHQRASWQGQLNEQVLDMRLTAEGLRRETQSLSTALRKPQVRGRWGELHLRRAVELAGLVDRCDFAEQVRLDDGARRPDLVVRLVGGRQRGGRRQGAAGRLPRRHLHRRRGRARVATWSGTPRQLRTHIDALGAKRYWRSLAGEPGVRGAVRARPSRSSPRRWRPTRA